MEERRKSLADMLQSANLDDSPMFRKQIQSSEESAESLRERCLKFYKSCRKYTEGLGEGYDADIAFVSALETFGGGHDDPISVAYGGRAMSKFTIALREIGTYKEVLRSQVEHMLNDRLLHFVNVDLLDVKEARKQFDKASLVYDQAREKYLSLRKGTKNDVAVMLEEELHNARSKFDEARFKLIALLSNIEAKQRSDILEAVIGTMDAQLRYFKQGYELLHQMEPYINQVLTHAQQTREHANCSQANLYEKMQDYKRQIERESRLSMNGLNGSPSGDGIHAIGRSSHKDIEAVMQSGATGKVQTIRQGYLSKRSSSLRGDWKRRFFVLDSKGMLYYYRKQTSKPSGSGGQLSGQRNSSELGSGLLSRWLSSSSSSHHHHHHHHGGVHDEKSVAHHTVNLLTSTIKADADQSDLRFCFRIISPTKNYTLQAESALDQMGWIEKITGVIASLLSSQAPERCLSASPMGTGHNRSASESSSFESSDFDHTAVEDYASERLSSIHFERPFRNSHQLRSCVKSEKPTDVMRKNSHQLRSYVKSEKPIDVLRKNSHQLRSYVNCEKPIDVLRTVGGNDECADCGAAGPDWASLNLGVLVCIECSGVHRNLGVHISKVRSLTLDVKVWEPSVLTMFQSLGNSVANLIWEGVLQSKSSDQNGVGSSGLYECDRPSKPSPADPIAKKEKFIHAKYADKAFVARRRDMRQVAQEMWEAVRTNDKKAVYRLIVSSEVDVNGMYEQAPCNSSLTLAKAMLLPEQTPVDPAGSYLDANDKFCTASTSGCQSADSTSLLHLACETADIGMLELLLQYGANLNASDSRGETALHRCILRGKTAFVKLLLARGADPHEANGEGKTPFELAMESKFGDHDILAVLSGSNG